MAPFSAPSCSRRLAVPLSRRTSPTTRAARPERLLHGPEDFPPLARADQDQPLRAEIEGGEAWGIGQGALQAPEHRARGTVGQPPGGKRGDQGQGTGLAEKFVQPRRAQATFGKRPVDRRHAEGERRGAIFGEPRPFDALDPAAQCRQHLCLRRPARARRRQWCRRRHDMQTGSGLQPARHRCASSYLGMFHLIVPSNVHILFLFSAESNRLSRLGAGQHIYRASC